MNKQRARGKNTRAKDAGDSIKLREAVRARSGIQRRKPASTLETPNYPIAKGRKALKGISIYMHPLAKEVLDRIAKGQNRTVQELGLEALNLLFRHYGEKPIA